LRARVNLVIRAPLGATRERVRELCRSLPELARLDVDELELALDLIPICVLAWRTPEQAPAIVRELADLDILVLDVHALHRLQLDCPTRVDSLLEVALAPAFRPCAVIQVIAALRAHPDPEPPPGEGRDGMDVELRLLDERGATLVIDRWSPQPDDAPRVHATLRALLEACVLLPLTSELRRSIADLRRCL
jgi:hypothetical protein